MYKVYSLFNPDLLVEWLFSEEGFLLETFDHSPFTETVHLTSSVLVRFYNRLTQFAGSEQVEIVWQEINKDLDTMTTEEFDIYFEKVQND